MEGHRRRSSPLKAVVKIHPGARLPKRVRNKLETLNFLQDICINSHAYETLGLEQALPKINKWIIPESLLIECNKCSILKPINDIHFVSLKKLSLRFNRIESIQIFSRIELPSLEKLLLGTQIVELGNNWIINMNSLRKANLPRLLMLEIDQNVVKEISKLPEMNMPALRKINSDRPDKYAGMDWIFKIDATITTLQISSFKRIEQPSQIQKVLQKFPYLNLIKKW